MIPTRIVGRVPEVTRFTAKRPTATDLQDLSRDTAATPGSGLKKIQAARRTVMNIAMWIVAGAILGWVGFAVVGFNEARGMIVSMIIGAVGGVIGGQLVAPMFSAVAAVPADFNVSALVFAAAAAVTLLFVGNEVNNRWDI
jgi:uncharacterized membrane protein YeaQ/YmgE (transglycosylase-associated protein family)